MNRDQVNSFVRAGLQAAAGVLVAKGLLDTSVVEPLIGVGLALVGLVWSWKFHA